MGDDTPIEKLGHSVTKKLDHNSGPFSWIMMI